MNPATPTVHTPRSLRPLEGGPALSKVSLPPLCLTSSSSQPAITPRQRGIFSTADVLSTPRRPIDILTTPRLRTDVLNTPRSARGLLTPLKVINYSATAVPSSSGTVPSSSATPLQLLTHLISLMDKPTSRVTMFSAQEFSMILNQVINDKNIEQIPIVMCVRTLITMIHRVCGDRNTGEEPPNARVDTVLDNINIIESLCTTLLKVLTLDIQNTFNRQQVSKLDLLHSYTTLAHTLQYITTASSSHWAVVDLVCKVLSKYLENEWTLRKSAVCEVCLIPLLKVVNQTAMTTPSYTWKVLWQLTNSHYMDAKLVCEKIFGKVEDCWRLLCSIISLNVTKATVLEPIIQALLAIFDPLNVNEVIIDEPTCTLFSSLINLHQRSNPSVIRELYRLIGKLIGVNPSKSTPFPVLLPMLTLYIDTGLLQQCILMLGSYSVSNPSFVPPVAGVIWKAAKTSCGKDFLCENNGCMVVFNAVKSLQQYNDALVMEYLLSTLEDLFSSHWRFKDKNRREVGSAGGGELFIEMLGFWKHESTIIVKLLLLINHIFAIVSTQKRFAPIATIEKVLTCAAVHSEVDGVFTQLCSLFVHVSAFNYCMPFYLLRKHIHNTEMTMGILRIILSSSISLKGEVDESSCSLIVEVLAVHMDNVAIVKAIGSILWKMCVNVNTRTKMGKVGCAVALLVVLRVHSEDQEVLKLACAALWYLSVTYSNCILLVDAGGVDLVMTSLKKNMDNENIARNLCAVACNISATPDPEDNEEGEHEVYPDFDEIVESPDWCDVMLQLLTAHPMSSKAVANTCGMLWNMCKVDSSRVYLGEKGLAEALVTVLKNHRYDQQVAEKVCGSLYFLARDPEQSERFAAAGGCEVLALALSDHHRKGEVAVIIAELIRLVAEVDANRIRFMEAGVLASLVTLMQTHHAEVELVEWVYMLIRKLTEKDEPRVGGNYHALIRILMHSECSVIMINKVCTEAVVLLASEEAYKDQLEQETIDCAEFVSKLKANIGKNSKIVRNLCAAVATLAWRKRYRTIFSKSDTLCETLVDVLNHFCDNEPTWPFNTEVIQSACDAIANLSAVDPLKVSLGAAGCCQAMLKVLTKYHEKVDVVRTVMVVLWNLSVCDINKQILFEMNIWEAFMPSFFENADDSEICGWACGFMWNLVMLEDCRQQLMKTEHVSEAMLGIMKVCCDDKEILRRACGVLSAVIDSKENMKINKEVPGCEVMVEVLKEYLDDPEIVETVGTLIWREGSEETRDDYVKENALPVLVDCLRRYSTNSRLVRVLCGAMWSLCWKGKYSTAEAFKDAGGCDVVANLLVRHLDGEIASTAIEALCATVSVFAVYECTRRVFEQLLLRDSLLKVLSSDDLAVTHEVRVQACCAYCNMVVDRDIKRETDRFAVCTLLMKCLQSCVTPCERDDPPLYWEPVWSKRDGGYTVELLQNTLSSHRMNQDVCILICTTLFAYWYEDYESGMSQLGHSIVEGLTQWSGVELRHETTSQSMSTSLGYVSTLQQLRAQATAFFHSEDASLQKTMRSTTIVAACVLMFVCMLRDTSEDLQRLGVQGLLNVIDTDSIPATCVMASGPLSPLVMALHGIHKEAVIQCGGRTLLQRLLYSDDVKQVSVIVFEGKITQILAQVVGDISDEIKLRVPSVLLSDHNEGDSTNEEYISVITQYLNDIRPIFPSMTV